MNAVGIEESKFAMEIITNHSDQDAVTFFENENCTGTSGTLHWGNSYIFAGSNKYRDRTELVNAHHTDNFQSVQVPPGFELILYDEKKQQGNSRVLRSEGGYLNELGLLKCQQINGAYESIAFRRVSEFEGVGYWAQSKYNGNIDFDMQIGYYSANGASKEQAKSDISFFMSEFSFEGELLTEEFAEAEKQNALHIANSTSKTQKVLCEALDNMAALYQWVIQIDGYTIHTDHFICRQSSYAWEFPSCPDSACEDDQCSICIEGWKQSSL